MRTRSTKALRPAQSHQMNIAFEASCLSSLSNQERMKVIALLANLLMLAAGAAAEEKTDER